MKLSLILATAIFPAQVLANDVPNPAEITVESASPQFLNPETAAKAFHQFEAVKESDVVSLYGTTSEKCMGLFEVKNDAKQGSFSIYFKGGDASCLDYAKLQPKENEITGLSKKSGSKMTPAASFESLSIRSEDRFSDRKPEILTPLLDANGEAIAFESAADIALKAKKLADAKRAKKIEFDVELVSTCGRDLNELEIAGNTLDALKDIDLVVVGKDAAWKAEQREKIDAEYFKKCSLQISRARSEEIGACDEQLSRIAASNPKKYGSKVKNLYFEKLTRYINSASMSPELALEKGLETLDQLDQLSPTDEEARKLDQAESALYAKTLDRAAKHGTESEIFQTVSARYSGFVLETDSAGCLDENLALLPAQRTNAKCAESVKLAMNFQQKAQLAAFTQSNLNRVAQQNAQKEQDAAHLQACQMMKASGAAATPDCAAAEARATALAKVAANEGLSSSAWGQITTPGAMTTTSTETPSTLQGGQVDVNARNVSGLPAAPVAPAPAPQVVAPAPVVPASNIVTTLR